MDFVRAMAFCSITKVRAAAKSSLRVKSRVQSPRSNTGCKRSCSSVISMQNEIGDMHPSTWKGCGESFSMEKGTTFVLARSEEHTSELQSRFDLVCRLLLEKKK